EMASRHVLVEIALTSNDVILNVRGRSHPFPTYLARGVPAALVTDDPGVSRSSLNAEYLRAETTYALPYTVLKTLARNSVAYAFLPGQPLWIDAAYTRTAAPCATSVPNEGAPAPSCAAFLADNEHAAAQYAVEGDLGAFERTVAHAPTAPH
ncbi:MAG: adenosine deaminase, partial [Candidatus Eremiobacteraeota bacterium]|nr:adenosine deaminase [Candidatus Eremiobacteraeota bacterium]